MKKVLTVLFAIVLAIMVLANLHHIIGLAINLVILYVACKQYLKSASVLGKLMWGCIGLIALGLGLGNFSAVIGILALGLLYVVYKDWKQQNADNSSVQEDPFTNFEQQWEQLNKNQYEKEQI